MFEIASSSIVSRSNISADIKVPDNNEGKSERESSFVSDSEFLCYWRLCNRSETSDITFLKLLSLKLL